MEPDSLHFRGYSRMWGRIDPIKKKNICQEKEFFRSTVSSWYHRAMQITFYSSPTVCSIAVCFETVYSRGRNEIKCRDATRIQATESSALNRVISFVERISYTRAVASKNETHVFQHGINNPRVGLICSTIGGIGYSGFIARRIV